MASSCERENVPPSPVPWISTMPPRAQPDDVQIDFGGRVFLVVEVEHDLAGDDACAHGRDAVAEDLAGGLRTEPAV